MGLWTFYKAHIEIINLLVDCLFFFTFIWFGMTLQPEIVHLHDCDVALNFTVSNYTMNITYIPIDNKTGEPFLKPYDQWIKHEGVG